MVWKVVKLINNDEIEIEDINTHTQTVNKKIVKYKLQKNDIVIYDNKKYIIYSFKIASNLIKIKNINNNDDEKYISISNLNNLNSLKIKTL